jgi:hypothetical protein
MCRHCLPVLLTGWSLARWPSPAAGSVRQNGAADDGRAVQSRSEPQRRWSQRPLRAACLVNASAFR